MLDPSVRALAGRGYDDLPDCRDRMGRGGLVHAPDGRGVMGEFAEELRAGICEAARNMAEARAAGDDYDAEVYRERLHFLRQVALRHSIQPPACPEPAASEAPGGQR